MKTKSDKLEFEPAADFFAGEILIFVVTFAGNNVNTVVYDVIQKPVFIVNSARPAIFVFQMFRFTETTGGAIAFNILKQLVNFISYTAIFVNPIIKMFPAVVEKYFIHRAFSSIHRQLPDAHHLLAFA